RGIYTVLLIILALWTLILMTIAFSQLYRFSIGKSLLVIILPVAVFSGLAAVILRALPEQFYWPW
ncbi:MAG TPA: hypothetical protein PLV45_10020, partial [bacterium]|nr:hypothetical protein [bacterium]